MAVSTQVEPTITITKDDRWIPQVVELSQKVSPDLNSVDFEMWLEENLLRQELLLIVICDEDTLVGYLFAWAPYLLDESVFIHHAYLDPKHNKNGLQQKVLAIVEAWARRWGAKSLRAIVKKNLRAWERKYGFELCSVVVERKI